MATPQPSSETLANTLISLYVLAEQQLLSGMAGILRRLNLTTDWVLALVRMRTLGRGVLGALVSQSNPLVEALVTAAITEGRRDADASVSRALERIAGMGAGGGRGGPPRLPIGSSADDFFDLSLPHGMRAAQAIRDDIMSELQDVRFRITRLPDDVYKMIAPHGAIYQALENGVTPAQAQAMAWRVFTSSGVTGFTDVSGRDWSLSAYVEMAVRTAANRAYNASHLARMHALGIHYFSVPDTGHPCPLCFPWQHRVLTDGFVDDPQVHVDATIAEAVAAGLFHPNCRHTLIPVIPGITVLPEPQVWTPEMEAGYRATQKQRRLELAVRKAKREADYAIDPLVQREALADVRRAQARVREFIRANEFGLLRQSRREQLNLTDHKIKLPTPIR